VGGRKICCLYVFFVFASLQPPHFNCRTIMLTELDMNIMQLEDTPTQYVLISCNNNNLDADTITCEAARTQAPRYLYGVIWCMVIDTGKIFTLCRGDIFVERNITIWRPCDHFVSFCVWWRWRSIGSGHVKFDTGIDHKCAVPIYYVYFL
jgi:hypothetical protein